MDVALPHNIVGCQIEIRNYNHRRARNVEAHSLSSQLSRIALHRSPVPNGCT